MVTSVGQLSSASQMPSPSKSSDPGWPSGMLQGPNTTKVSGTVPMLNPPTPRACVAKSIPKSGPGDPRDTGKAPVVSGAVVVSWPSNTGFPMPVKRLG